MQKWEHPPITKVYEALGTVADGRIQISGNTARCFSSSGNKYYEVVYDPATNAIMANDNSSYWQGHLGYPSIAFLLQSGVLAYREDMGTLLKGVAWKDINQRFKNDFEKALAFILEGIDPAQRVELDVYAGNLLEEIRSLDLKMLGEKRLPPKGY